MFNTHPHHLIDYSLRFYDFFLHDFHIPFLGGWFHLDLKNIPRIGSLSPKIGVQATKMFGNHHLDENGSPRCHLLMKISFC